MPPTEADEAAFMNALMQGLEADFWSAAPTPDASPVKSRLVNANGDADASAGSREPLRAIQPASSPRTPSRPSIQAHSKDASTSTSRARGPATSKAYSAAASHDLAAFLQGSENWDLDADPFSSSPVKPAPRAADVKKHTTTESPAYTPDPCTRCVVESVSEDYVNNRWQKTVIARVQPGDERVEVALCDDWYQTDVRIDDIINVIGHFHPSPTSSPSHINKRTISITSQANFLILHPDLLLTATALSNAPQCRRKPLLSALVRSSSDTTPALVWGSMLHEVMQRCLLEERWDEGFIGACVEEAVRGGLGELVKLGVGEEVARREVGERAVGLRGFRERYLADVPKENGELMNTRSGAYDAPSLLAINKVLDVEEEILSPTYGIKGKLDATVQGIISDPVPSPKSNPNSKPTPTSTQIQRTLTHTPLPLELKTGRPGAGMEHRAQTMLYTLLLSERYGADVKDGLLFYTQSPSGEVVRVPRGRNEIRGLVGVRNELVGFMWRRIRRGKKVQRKDRGAQMDVDVDMEDIVSSRPASSKNPSPSSQSGEVEEEEEIEHFLPPPIDDPRACTRCYAIDTCLLFRKIHPNHSLPLSPIAPLPSSSNPSQTTSLNPSQTTPTPLTPSKRRALALRRTLDPPLPDFLQDLYESKTSHLTPSRIEFFARWERLLALEERDLVRFRRELWTLGAGERERGGRCFGGMVLVGEGRGDGDKAGGTESGGERESASAAPVVDEEREWGKEGKIHRFTYTFARSARWVPPTPTASPSSSGPRSSGRWSNAAEHNPQSLLNGHMSVGDPITVSVEPKLLALARGYILELTPERVVLGVDHVLDLEGIRERLRRDGRDPSTSLGRRDSSTSLGRRGSPTSMAAQAEEVDEVDEVIFRIDKDELFGGMARVRNNLAQMFYADGDRKRLELVVDLRRPVFSPPTPAYAGPGFDSSRSSPTSKPTSNPTSNISSSTPSSTLNPSQLSAIRKILSAEDYALVLGMPGTGKTTVIAEAIRELVRRGKSVLLSSYTHSAVDTILGKLEGAGEGEGGVKGKGGKGGRDAGGGGFGILRLGNVDKVHPAVRKYTLAARRKPTTVEQYEKQLLDAPVVATTCLSIDHALFSRRKFDYCIVDEASQITLPTCLGPLRFADVFILVGDHYQLPPLVKNPQARQGGLDISLFRRLSEAHPEAVVDLRYQYRMNEDIMFLSNRLIYDERLMCGSEEVRGRALRLDLGGRGFLGRLHGGRGGRHEGEGRKGECWLEKVVDESCKAVFIDTDALNATESRVGDLVQNTTEAELVRQLVETLLHCGVSEAQIGIISLYRQQVKLLQHLLQERTGVEILTADKSQGRDKDCVIVSLVRSNEGGHIGELVKDWRRMNVSFTRARSKLVIFGSRKTLQREPLLAQFFELMESRGWILRLKNGADRAHERVFGGVGVPGAGAGASPSGRKRSVSVSVGGCEGDEVEDEVVDEVEVVGKDTWVGVQTQTQTQTQTQAEASSSQAAAEDDEDVEFVEATQTQIQAKATPSQPDEDGDVEFVEATQTQTQIEASSSQAAQDDDDVEFVDDTVDSLTFDAASASAPTSKFVSPDATLCSLPPSDVGSTVEAMEDSWMEDQTLVVPEAHGFPLPMDSKAPSTSSEPKAKTLDNDNDDIEIVEIKNVKPSAKPSTTAPASKPKLKPRTELPSSSSSSAPRKAVGKENTLMGWLNVKEKDRPKGKGMEKENSSKLSSQDTKKKGRSTTASGGDRASSGVAASGSKVKAKENGNGDDDKARPSKRAKLDGGKSAGGGAGVLKGRPILRDLVGNET